VVSHGMSRVNGRLLGCLTPELKAGIVNRAGAWWKEDDLAPSMRNLHRPNSFLQRIQRFLGSRSPDKTKVGFAEGALLSWWLKSQSALQHGDLLFCPCGADPGSAIRAYRLAKAAKLRCALYLVDDFTESHRLAHGKALDLSIQSELSGAIQGSKILTISEGLQARIHDVYGVSSSVVPLPYHESPPLPESEPASQILFVGNVSHFYQDGLRDMAKAIAETNEQTGANLTLRITLGKPEKVDREIGSYPFIVCGSSGGSEDLSREISRSLLCFLPYSFKEEYRVMVSTSFPSKLLDYLASARSVLCYAPSYASSTQYFKAHSLPQSLSQESQPHIKRLLVEHLDTKPNHSAIYRETLKREHSQAHVRECLTEALFS
jgi:hypothetical protein